MEEKVKQAIEKVRPALQRSGGDIEFVSMENGVVRVRLRGACSGCPMSQITIKSFVERVVMDEVPGVTAVETV